MIRVISRESGRDITPGVEVFADGSCRIKTVEGDEYTTKLERSTVRGLLSFLEREGLFSISDESIERAIDRELQPVRTELPGGGVSFTSRGRVFVTDSAHARISARAGTNSVRISRYALESEIEHYRTVTELRTVQRCIQRVYDVGLHGERSIDWQAVRRSNWY